MSSFTSPYGSTCCQKSGVRPTSVFGGEHVGPGVFGEHVLEHECVYVDESGLQDPQAKRSHFLFVLAVGCDLTALAVVDDRVRAVERLDDVESLGDLPLELATAQEPGDEDGALGPPDFQHRLIGGV